MSFTSDIVTTTSALTAASIGMSVVGNNVANINTGGYKGESVTFGDLLNSALGQTSTEGVGSGVVVQAITTQFKAGTIQNTGNPLDFAISGDGFFTVQDISKKNAIAYTRAGSFSLDKTGNIVDPSGNILQGYLADSKGNIGKTLAGLNLSGILTTSAKATTTATVISNLSAGDPAPVYPGTQPPVAWTWQTADPSAPVTVPPYSFATSGPKPGSYNSSTSLNIVDSVGNTHTVNIYFAKQQASGSWNAYAVWDAGVPDLSGNITVHSYQSQAIPMSFDPVSGNLLSPLTPTQLQLTWGGGQAQSLSLNFSDTSGSCTQYGSADSNIFQTTDGNTAGSLTSVNMGNNGILTGTYDNGQEVAVAQIVLAKFQAPTQLAREGNNLYTATAGSGVATLVTPGTGGAGTVTGGALEASNVDETTQFQNMILYQNAFSANSTVMKAINTEYSSFISMIS
ncbi:MAG: flagellar hook-basal body complex protein [Nitrospirae bacterium]|nr:flagellar hook-basal body complex protein [Nitrospirota bacterium]